MSNTVGWRFRPSPPNPYKKHLNLQTAFGVSHNAVWVRLKQLGFTLKKLIKYRERNEVQRWLFRRELEKLVPANVYNLDECGVDYPLYRELT